MHVTMWLLTLLVVWVVACAPVVAACMLSSRISRRRGE